MEANLRASGKINLIKSISNTYYETNRKAYDKSDVSLSNACQTKHTLKLRISVIL